MTTRGIGNVGDDRIAIEEVLYRYASSVDSAQMHQLHDVLHPDLQAQYGNGEPVQGAEAVIAWMTDFTKTCEWQHHMLNVYRIDIEGDKATALVYHNSFEKFAGDDDVCFFDRPLPQRAGAPRGHLEDFQARIRNHLG